LNDKDNIPDLITESFDRLKKNFHKLTLHIENDDIPSTNNLVELFFNVTGQNKFKKYYKTDKGLDSKMKINLRDGIYVFAWEKRYVHETILNSTR